MPVSPPAVQAVPQECVFTAHGSCLLPVWNIILTGQGGPSQGASATQIGSNMGVESSTCSWLPGHVPDHPDSNGSVRGHRLKTRQTGSDPWPDCRQWTCFHPGLQPVLLILPSQGDS